MPATLKPQEQFTKQTVLFVEGRDEIGFFAEILHDMKINHIEVREIGGRDQLATQLPVAIKVPSFATVTCIGVIQDADEDENAALQRVCNVLKKCNLPAPPANQNGVVVNNLAGGKKMRVGVLIIPGGGRKGYLEDLFLDASVGIPALKCVDKFSVCVESCYGNSFDSKSRAYSLMVALGIRETRLGRGFESKQLGVAHTSYDVVKDFVRQL